MQRSTHIHEIDNSITKILGLFWSSNTDTVQFQIREKHFKSEDQVTGRGHIIRTRTFVFDPLGLVGPIVQFVEN